MTWKTENLACKTFYLTPIEQNDRSCDTEEESSLSSEPASLPFFIANELHRDQILTELAKHGLIDSSAAFKNVRISRLFPAYLKQKQQQKPSLQQNLSFLLAITL